MSYHGVVYVDMQPLLYPGATQIKGAYKINPFVENDFLEKVIKVQILLVYLSIYKK